MEKSSSLKNHDDRHYGAVKAHGEPLVDESNVCTKLWKKVFPYGFAGEFKELLTLAWPVVLTQVSQTLIPLLALIFCGHLGKAELDAVALANSVINVTGISVAVGLSAACDTLFSQIFGGSNKLQLGSALQRSILMMLMAAFICLSLHINAERILRAIGQDPEVARLTGEYMLIFIPGLLSFFLYVPLTKYIQNQNIVIPTLVIGLFANCVNALSHYLLIHVAKMSTNGSAVSQVLSYFTMLALTLVYIRVSQVYKDTWSGWSTDCLQDWGTFFKLAIAGLLMVCIELWSWELGVFLSGILGTTDLGAQSVLIQMEAIVYMVPLGAGIAVSIKVGQHLGAGDAKGALTSARVALSTICVSGLVVGLLLTCLKDYLPQIFTNVQDVVKLISSIMPIFGLYMVFDNLAAVCGGIFRGAGKQKTGAVAVFFVYATGLSIAIPIMFRTKLGLKGLWLTLATALAIEALLFLFIVFRMDWNEQAEKAKERANAEKAMRPGFDMQLETATSLLSLSSEHDEGIVPDGCFTHQEVGLETRKRKQLISESSDHSETPQAGSVPLRQLALPRLAAVSIVLAIFGTSLAIRLTLPDTTVGLPYNTSAVNTSVSSNTTTVNSTL